jgi:hypothetical protein
VQQSITNGVSPVLFDQSEFAKLRKPVSKSFIDVDRLNNLVFLDSWSKYMTVHGSDSDNQFYEGVSDLIAQHFSLKLTTMLSNKTFSSEATKLCSHFFSELVLSSVLTADAPTLESVHGQVTMTDRRIMVVTEIEMTLVVLCFLAFDYLLSRVWSVSVKRRPLCLQADPATIVGATLVSNAQSGATGVISRLQGKSRKEVKTELGQHIYVLDAGLVTEITPYVANPVNEKPVEATKSYREYGFKRLEAKYAAQKMANDLTSHLGYTCGYSAGTSTVCQQK